MENHHILRRPVDPQIPDTAEIAIFRKDLFESRYILKRPADPQIPDLAEIATFLKGFLLKIIEF